MLWPKTHALPHSCTERDVMSVLDPRGPAAAPRTYRAEACLPNAENWAGKPLSAGLLQ